MELLLWMWLYDTRWFFNIKTSIKLYKLMWLIPLLMQFTISVLCYYDLPNEENNDTCKSSLKIWLMCRIIFSLMISLNILIFMIKISVNDKKENSYFENAKKIFPHLNEINDDYDFWIKRKSMISTSGITLLILGLVNMIWSYQIIKMYYYDNMFVGYGDLSLYLLGLNSIFTLIANVPLLLLVIILTFVKVFAVLCAFLCPGGIRSYPKIIDRIKQTVK